MTGNWVDLGRREDAIAFIDEWKQKTSLPAKIFCRWLKISESKLSVWRSRTGIPNSHAPFTLREDCLSQSEVDVIVEFYCSHLKDGYRRYANMMMDEDIAYVSPSTVYHVLKRSGVMRQRNGKPGCKGKGFEQGARHSPKRTDECSASRASSSSAANTGSCWGKRA